MFLIKAELSLVNLQSVSELLEGKLYLIFVTSVEIIL